MKKETVKMFNLEAAFKALDELEIPAVTGGRTIANRINLHERLHAKDAHEVLVEDYFDVNDVDELEAAKEEREAEVAKAKLARIEKIVDLDAETEDDILPSYEGKIIMQCPQCMTLFYKNEEDIEKSEETPDVVNVNEICQHCGNSSGYTLVGKVGKIDETEAENFELEDLPVEENDSEADLTDEGTEEDAENLDLDLDALDETSEAEDLDLDLDLDLADEEEETNESMHKSSLLKTIEKENDLKSELDSEHLTLNEEIDKTQEAKQPEETVEESMHNSGALKDAEEASDLKSDIESENLTLLESDSEVEEATDELFDKLWSAPQPTEEETEANLANLGEAVEQETISESSMDLEEAKIMISRAEMAKLDKAVDDATEEVAKYNIPMKSQKNSAGETEQVPNFEAVPEEQKEAAKRAYDAYVKAIAARPDRAKNIIEYTDDLEEQTEELTAAEDFDEESFNKCLNEYVQKVYSNVKCFEATSCSITDSKLIVEGLITFNSDKSKTTKFIFEGKSNTDLVGKNIDFSDEAAFKLSTKIANKTIYTESLKYSYKINESLVSGVAQNK